jgi:hypothetical protein
LARRLQLISQEDAMHKTTTRYTFTSWTTRGGADAIAALSEEHVEGRRDGWTIAFYDNGKKACEGRFREGVEDGWWVFWSHDGVPVAAVDFVAGQGLMLVPAL